MTSKLTTDEREELLGRTLRQLRLRQNVDQRTLAERADVALNAVKRLEAGKGSTITSFVKILRALGREDWLETLAPRVTVSPLLMLKTGATERRRASAPRKPRDPRA